MTDTFAAWAARHRQAAHELLLILSPDTPDIADTTTGSEARVQSQVRLEAARKGYRLWRNNSGALTDEAGRLIRYGLGNDSSLVNARIKSSDLVGWRPILIAGQKIAQFVSIETKRPGWHLTQGDKRGNAQAAWLTMVENDGGMGRFVDQEGML